MKGGQSRLGGGSPRKFGESTTQLDSKSIATGTERGGSPVKSMYPGSMFGGQSGAASQKGGGGLAGLVAALGTGFSSSKKDGGGLSMLNPSMRKMG